MNPAFRATVVSGAILLIAIAAFSLLRCVDRAAPTSLILPCLVQASERSSCSCRVSIPDDYQGQLFATIRQTAARGTPRTPALSWRTANKKTAFSKVNLPFFGLLASLALSIRFHRNPQSRSIR